MTHVIPQPVAVDAHDGYLGVASLTGVAAPPELHSIAAHLGFPIREGGTIRIGLSGEGLDSLPATHGIRADGGDLDAERYGLRIDGDGIRIWAPTPEGVFRGVTTLRQMIGTADGSLPFVEIVDAPRFAWRGLLLDTARRFFPAGEVRQVIDLMAMYKLNVLHFHLTDAEGWRIPIASRPNLIEMASKTARGKRPGGHYSVEEYRDLVQYAADRFITIVPEFDMPGHTAAIFRAYPELAGDGQSGDVSGTAMLQFLHPDNPGVFPFVEDVVREIAALTPGKYIHIGGDEAWGMPHDAYVRFVKRAREIVRDAGKDVIAWQEATRADLPPEDLVQYWLEFDPASLDALKDVDPETVRLEDGPEMTPEIMDAFMAMLRQSTGDVDRAMVAGNRVLMSISTKSYLDTPYAEPSADPDQESDRARLGMPFYPKQTVLEFADWEPGAVHPRLPIEAIAGVEAAIWCESVTSLEDALFLALPKLPGIAERAWSPAVFDTGAYLARLGAHGAIWQERGWNFFRSSLVPWRMGA